MGINRQDVFNKENRVAFEIKNKEKIREKFGYDVWYYYRINKIKKLEEPYVKKSTEDIGRLSRKYVFRIGINMLKTICELCDNNKTNIEFEYDQTELIRKVIELVNYFFVYMNHVSWEKYWDEEELDWGNEDTDTLFWSQYCLVEAQDHDEKLKARKREELRREQFKLEEAANLRRIECRKEAVKTLGEEEVLEYEYIVPDLNWAKVFEDEEYGKTVVNAYEQYWKFKSGMKCCEDKNLVEEYCLYVAKLYMQGREGEQIPVYEFGKNFWEE